MSRKKTPDPEVHTYNPAEQRGTLKPIGGSMSDDWNNLISNQTARTLWHCESTDPETKKQERFASISALVGIAPRDECEGMIAAQLVACHHAAMECYRRAMLPEQTLEGRDHRPKKGSTPCSWTCSGHGAVWPEPGMGCRASRLRCRTAAAGCTAARLQGLRRGIKMLTSMASTRPRR
jgi:hypothetical protein